MNSEHAERFAGLPVRDYSADEGIVDPIGSAQRLSVDYDAAEGGETLAGLLDRFLADPAAGQVRALVVGAWESVFDSANDSAPIVAALAAARDRLTGLKALFLGDITSDEAEISWISQSDVTPLLEAYPALEHLQVRGGNGLALGPIRHEGLRTLVIESGGLPASVVQSVGASDFPNLEHLELWLGTDNYGGDATVEDLAPILSGERLPRLKYLGLRDSQIADRVAAALAEAPILRRIEVLDLSLGTLGDDGALALMSGGALAGLKRLDIHHHYVSDEVLDGLQALGVELDASDQEEPDEDEDGDYRYVAVGE